ncbi:MAG: hypothetical protein QOJ29_2431 [Thermoleophilaceae bacterium]|jgi:hypothetical protein|nr:hypothetical protein [Thermoleophilaceae bacterium]
MTRREQHAESSKALAGAASELTVCVGVLTAASVATLLVGAAGGLYSGIQLEHFVGAVMVVLVAAGALAIAVTRSDGVGVTGATRSATRVEPRSRTVWRVVTATIAAVLVSGAMCGVLAALLLGIGSKGVESESVARLATLLQGAWLTLFNGRCVGLLFRLRRTERRLGAELLVKPFGAGQRGAVYARR